MGEAMIKLFASDLDGTLLNAQHKMDDKIRRTLAEVTATGAHFAVATGRVMRSSDDYGFAGVDCEAVCSNGAVVLGRTGEILCWKQLDQAFIEALMMEFADVSMEFTAVEDGRVVSLVTGGREEHLLQMRHPNPLKRAVRCLTGPLVNRASAAFKYGCSAERVLRGTVCKLNTRVPNAVRREELHAFVHEWGRVVVDAPTNPTLFEVTNVGVDKGAAVAWLAEYLGFSPDEVTVYGDGGNDVPMLERFSPYGHAYAPLGASSAAKRVASEVIGPSVLHSVCRHMARTASGR